MRSCNHSFIPSFVKDNQDDNAMSPVNRQQFSAQQIYNIDTGIADNKYLYAAFYILIMLEHSKNPHYIIIILFVCDF